MTVRKVVTRLLFVVIAIAIGSAITVNLMRVNTKVFTTQLDLGIIGLNIQDYNESYMKSDRYTEYIEGQFQARRDLANSEDPIVAASAKHGFSIILFMGSLAVYAGTMYIWYLAIKNRRSVVRYGSIGVANLIWVLSIGIAFVLYAGSYLFEWIARNIGLPVRVRRYHKRNAGIGHQQQNTKDKKVVQISQRRNAG